jgi:hypothetical protein
MVDSSAAGFCCASLRSQIDLLPVNGDVERCRDAQSKPGKRLTQPRCDAKLAHNRAKWY